MTKLPAWMQPLLTQITGKPLSGDATIMTVHSGKAAFIVDIILLTAFSVLQAALLIYFPNGGYLSLPVFWVAVTGLLRKMQVVYLHHMVHNSLFLVKKMNALWGDILASVFFVQNFDEYKTSHIAHHKNNIFTTTKDDDAAFLYNLGFRPGCSVRRLWQLLFVTLISPTFHITFTHARIKSAVITSGIRGKIIVCFWCLVLLYMLVTLPWKVFFLVMLEVNRLVRIYNT